MTDFGLGDGLASEQARLAALRWHGLVSSETTTNTSHGENHVAKRERYDPNCDDPGAHLMEARRLLEQRNATARYWNKRHPNERPLPMARLVCRDGEYELVEDATA